MPIQNKDLGKYKRPGIFINEIDNSIIELPVQNVLINLVPGFSKKGPVNRPVYITNTVDFEKIFGDIDRGLERKGSYFHRTCIKMLESGPIWALNLLSTDDTLDTINWKSISCGAAYDNAATKSMPFSRIFNRQDFWERDDESFLDYVNDPTIDTSRLLHLTNLGEKTTTTLIYKSTVTGFDVTAEDWYGGVQNVPSYIHPKDWVSDYIVSVLILAGDWTDYDALSEDTTWGTYFTTEGLDKTKIQDFVDETNVTTLSFYDVSFIPYFKDKNGRDMYIKSVINNDTDKTGLFCAYYEDLLLDSDYPTGKVDIIGDGVVGQETTAIDFLSYQESIIESLTYTNTPLDSHGNVFGNYATAMPYGSTGYAGKDSRTGNRTNWYVDTATVAPTGSTLFLIEAIQSSTGESWLSIDTTTPASVWQTSIQRFDLVYFNVATAGLSANTAYYIADVTQSGGIGPTWFTVSTTLGGASITLTESTPTNLYMQRGSFNMASLTNAYFNLGGTAYTFDTGTTEYVFEPLEFSNLTSHAYNRYDVLYLTEGDNATVNILKGTQSNNGTADLPEFTTAYEDVIILGYVHLSLSAGTSPSASTSSALVIDYTPITLNSTGYIPLDGIVATGYTIGTSSYVKLTFANTSGLTSVLSNYNLLRYRAAYNELEGYLDNSKGLIVNQTTGYKYPIENATFTDYSTSYDATIVISVGTETPTEFYDNSNTYKWLVYYLDNEFFIDDGISATGVDRLMTTLAPADDLFGSGQTDSAGVIGQYSDIYLDYYNGQINNGDFGYIDNISGTTGTKIYMKMWEQDTNSIYIDFMSDTTASASPQPIIDWTSTYVDQFIVWSNISNYRQTLEIEDLDTSKLPTLIYQIKVDKNRYSEIIKGDFLEAYYDESLYASGGALYGYDPRKLTRIISTSIDTTDTSLKVLNTDAPIKITTYTKVGGGSDYHTNVYPQIDTYVSTYKGIALTPFTIRVASMPDGTEARQDSILDVIEKTTNLTQGLINKNKISWRYLVDSFGLGLASASKQQYADLCGLKLNCLGFINAPSVKTLKNSSNPSFTNDDRTLNTAYLREGGDETKNPSFLYSFATGVGRSTVAYFFPYVTVDDLGTPKNVPPAAHVATTYMRKHTTTQSAIEPWTIAAGISNGRVTNIAGVEMDFTNTDLENLNQMGLNAIVKKRNAGYCIDAENTAQVYPYSSLSIIHSRELLIELENSLYDMLLRYQWRFNTPEIRAEIKFRADRICKDLQDRNGLYDFKNVIDETNNTNYIIDLQMGVLDTYIEIVKGMGIIVNNITILKKGDIQSGGFTQQ